MIAVQLIGVLVLVALNGFFAAAEFSLVAVRLSRVRQLVAKGDLRARVVENLLGDLHRVVSGVQVGITVTSLAIGALGESALAKAFQQIWHGTPGSRTLFLAHAVALAGAFALLSAMHVVLGELVPKTVSLARAERVALLVALPFQWFLHTFRLAIDALDGASGIIVKALGVLLQRIGHSEARLMFPRFTSSKLSLPQSAILLIAALTTAFSTSSVFSSTSSAHQTTPANTAQVEPQPRDALTTEGPFTIANQRYTVLFHYKVLAERASPSAPSANSAATLSQVEIRDAHSNSVYHQDFLYTVTQMHFQQNLTASASLLGGNGGAALVIRFLDHRTGSAEAASGFAKESWQLIGVANGRLAPLGPVLPLGHGTDIAVGGVVTAVMMKGGIAIMPMASTAEVLAFRAWTGSFYAMVPMRFDWAHGQWGEGSQCYQTANGTLTERGCIMPVQANPRPRSPNADAIYVHLFVAPDGNTDNSVNVPVSPEARVEVLEMQAIVRWHIEGLQDQRVTCSFSNVWLRARINGQEGWVHGPDAFDAIGLPLANPQ